MPTSTAQTLIESFPETVHIETLRDATGNQVWVNKRKLSLRKSLRYKNHSPTGFEWGYGGSGPAQLSLAILLEFIQPDDALRLYQDFKFNFVAGLPRADFIKPAVPMREIMRGIIEAKM